MKILANNSDQMLPLTSQMATSLQNIETEIGGVANIITGNDPGIQSGTGLASATSNGNSSAIGNFLVNDPIARLSTISSIPGEGLVGSLLNSITGSLFGKSSSSVTDSGLQIGGSIGSLEQGQGINQYANVQTNSSSFFGLVHSSSDSTQTAAVSQAISQQFALIFQNLQTTLQAAGSELGKSSTDVGTAVSEFVLNTTKVSLKGLTGTALTDAINAVISASMDSVSKSIFPELGAFQQIGEGYTETVVRVATGIEQAGSALQHFGITAINYTDIINKQGDIGAEIVRQSIDAVETATNGTMTGIGKIIQTASGAASDLATLYQNLLDVRKLMNDTHLNGQDVSASMIQGAGGTSNLNTGLSNYLSDYFTPAEQSASEMKDLAAQFAALNVAMPTTKDGFRALVSSIDTSTDAGQKLIGQLLNLSGAFSDAVDHANALATATSAATQAQQHALDEQLLQAEGNTAAYTAATRADTLATLSGQLLLTQEEIYAAQDKQAAIAKATSDLTAAYNAQAASLNATITSMKQFASSIATFKDQLTLGSESTLSPQDKYNQAKSIYEATLTAAQSGDTTAQGNLQANATAFLDASKAYNASTAAYQMDFADVQSDMAKVESWAQQQVSAAQAQLVILNAQVSSLITINTSVLSVQAAIQGLQNAMAMSGGGGGGFTSQGAAAGSSSAWDTKAGLDSTNADGSWSNAVAQAMAAASGNAAAFLTKYTAAGGGNTVLPTHADGLVSVPYDNYVAELHAGEGVIDAPAMAAMRRYFNAPAPSRSQGGGNNDAIVTELREQNQHLAAMVSAYSTGTVQIIGQLAKSNVALDGIKKKANLEAAR
jgi:hypothetical protein